MEELVKSQYEVGAKLQQIYSNFKKDSPDRKKNTEYFTKRITTASALFAQFELQNQELSDNHLESLSDNDYFKTNYYQEIKKLYEAFTAALNAGLKGIVNPSDGTTITQESSEATHSEVSAELLTLVNKQKRLMDIIQHYIANIKPTHEQLKSISYLNMKLDLLKQKWNELIQNDETIWSLTSNKTINGYSIEEFYKADSSIQSAILAIQEQIEKIKTSEVTVNEPPNFKLSRIELPTFNGNYLKWTSFRDLFCTVIHKTSMPKTQKMFYLVSHLSGEAKMLIQHLSITEENYEAAWSIIESRYNNLRLLVNSWVNRLISQPSITAENPRDIRILHDITKECLSGLESLGVQTSGFDVLLVHLLIKKLDRNTHALFEQNIEDPKEIPTVSSLLTFLEWRFQALEAIGKEKRLFQQDSSTKHQNRSKSSLITTREANNCIICKQNHALYHCKQFLQQNIQARRETVKNHNLCYNCLQAGHRVSICKSSTCKKCSQHHHTLLHTEQTKKAEQTNRNVATTNSSVSAVTTTQNLQLTSAAGAFKRQTVQVLLSTVLLHVLDKDGNNIPIRAVLDIGSQANFLTTRALHRLGLQEKSSSIQIKMLGNSSQPANRRVNITIKSRLTKFSSYLEAYVLTHILDEQPASEVDIRKFNIPPNIQLADPDFHKPAKIDLLIGAELFLELLKDGKITLGENQPVLQNTVFGWIVGGRNQVFNIRNNSQSCALGTLEETYLQNTIERFWKQEEITEKKQKLTQAEKHSEEHFAANTTRNQKGQFVVKLPFRKEPSVLGQSKDIAIRRFFQLERRLQQNPNIRQQYVDILQEYEDLGYIEKTQFPDPSKQHYFVPHHFVEKADSITTKIRPVFDFSAKTSTNYSLNDILETGPTLQPELFTILLKFRTPKYVFTADIKQMYLQIHLNEDDKNYQLMIWRKNIHEGLHCYKINRVAFGSTSAPYLAIKCVQELAKEFSDKYPLGAKIIMENMYVDDGMCGSNTLSEAMEMQNQIQQLLKIGGFELRKWCANNASLLNNIPVEHRAIQLNIDGIEENETCKTLGLIWYPAQDEFKIKIGPPKHKRITKRTILSEISSIFDPLGLVGPVTINAKVFMQRLWSLDLKWDASLPLDLLQEWVKFRQDLAKLDDVRFPRHIFKKNIPTEIQIHTFADASNIAFGAAVYLRAVYKDKTISAQLLCAKSKVAPIQTVSLPRLELCAAVLAAELNQKIKTDLNLHSSKNFLWTDSTIVLDWIHSQAAEHHTYVANRISRIQQLTKHCQWRHVPSKQNPADIISRGVTPEKFKNTTLWMYGPLFLYGEEKTWPARYERNESTIERRAVKRTLTTTIDDTKDLDPRFLENINHRNSLNTLIRIVAYCLRLNKHNHCFDKQNKYLTTRELDNALLKIIKRVQDESFEAEIKQLKKHNVVSSDSDIRTLSPFLDDMGILRTGGRIEKALINYNAKHPILLPYKHWFTNLVMESIHRTHYHAGERTLLAITRQKFWPIKGVTIAKQIIHKCVICAKAKPQLLQQIMGNLPASRVQPSRPFITTGVDFAGPVQTHYKVRGKKPQKTYIAVFCCFATKAIHLELVSDLTTNAFIGALKRFTARRGNCRDIICDNATNFVGAKNTLSDIKEIIHNDEAKAQIYTYCNNKGINFKFIPPRAPHFGGLWEAAVKSAKGLMRKHIGEASLTYEELETVIVEIEAILNSRPLTPLSEDPNDLEALTPGHFLIGEPLTSTIDSQAVDEKKGLIKRWELVSKIKRDFWRRWSSEYLSNLQHRYKWKKPIENIKIGTMVLIKEDNVPVLNWNLGRVMKVIPGEDGFIRVADIKTARGIFRRPIHKLAPLPISTQEESNNNSNESVPAKGITDPKIPPVQDAETKETPPQKRRRPTGANSLITTLIATTFLTAATGSHAINIKPFTSPPVILFERMGDVNLINNEWSLLIYYNLTTFWKEFTTITTGIEQLHQLCYRMENDYCNITTRIFSQELERLNTQNEYLIPTNSKRNKRGALNIVGNIANSLFGVLDSEYAKQMETTINNLHHNEEHLNSLIKNQTSIIDNTLSLIKGNEKEIEKHFNEIEGFINHTDKLVDKIQEELRQQNIHQVFSQVSTRLLLMIGNLQSIQNSFLQLIMDSQHGKINPTLLSLRQLKQEILRIKDHIPADLRLPTTSNNILEMYSFIEVESSITTNLAMFRLKIPLVSYNRYELLHVVPVPWSQNGSNKIIKTATPYMIVDLHRDQYYPLTEQELSTCTTTKSLQYMCKQHHQLYRNTPAGDSCEISAISHTGSTKNCIISTDAKIPRWTQLFQPNHWMYAAFNPIIINLICTNNNTQLVLNGTGIIEINDDCIIKDETTTIQPHKLYSSAFKTSFVASSNVFQTNITTIKENINVSMSKFNSSVNMIDELEQKVHTLQEAERTIVSENYSNNHPYILCYCVLIFITLGAIYACYIKWHHKPKQQPPENQQTTTQTPEVPKRRKLPTLAIIQEDIENETKI